MIVALGAAAGLFFAIALLLVRLILGPSLHDRVLAAHAIALVGSLAAAAFAAAANDGALLDAAIMFVLTDFVVAMASLKFLRLRSLQASLVPPQRAEG